VESGARRQSPLRLGALSGREATPVLRFGRHNFGVRELLSPSSGILRPAAAPDAARQVDADEPKLTGFVFKIQANMDPGIRDRIAFMRLCSGRYAARHAPASCAVDKDYPRRRRPDISGGPTAAKRRRLTPATSSGCTIMDIKIGDTFTEARISPLRGSRIPLGNVSACGAERIRCG